MAEKLPWIITCEELRRELEAERASVASGKPIEAPITLLDVREEEEHEESRIGGEKLVPLSDFMARFQQALPDRDANIVIYCAHGVRSMHALRALQQLGYTRLRSLDGGICAWLES